MCDRTFGITLFKNRTVAILALSGGSAVRAYCKNIAEQCLRGELATTDAVKRAIRGWRPDFIRA